MYIGSQKLMYQYDTYLLTHGYNIIQLVDLASDCLLKHMNEYHSLCILCGPGNNGADGLSLAFKLHQEKKVNVFIFSEIDEKRFPANAYYYKQCLQANVHVYLVDEEHLEQCVEMMKDSDAIVDAMFGFGLDRAPRGIYQSIIEEVNQLDRQEIIAVDIPTGLNCNTGMPYQSVICATKTISLTAMKDGFLNPDSQLFTGQVIVELLHVRDVFDEVGLYCWADEQIVMPILKNRKYDGHKGDYGRIGMITGCFQYKGAALLSAKSAVYSGSGIVSVISVSEVIEALTLFCPEATAVLRPSMLSSDLFEKYQALLIGSGLGLDIEAYSYFSDVLENSQVPLVIDGDALTILSSNIDVLKKQKRAIVLTPHMGEFHRLCDFKAEDDLLFIATQFAKKHHVILVLKGPHTIVTDGHESYRVSTGNPAMSSGGMGDVLAGMITSFLGQGYEAIQAALLAVYIHGYIGDQLAKNAYTVIPSRVIEEIPQVMYKMKKK